MCALNGLLDLPVALDFGIRDLAAGVNPNAAAVSSHTALHARQAVISGWTLIPPRSPAVTHFSFSSSSKSSRSFTVARAYRSIESTSGSIGGHPPAVNIRTTRRNSSRASPVKRDGQRTPTRNDSVGLSFGAGPLAPTLSGLRLVECCVGLGELAEVRARCIIVGSGCCRYGSEKPEMLPAPVDANLSVVPPSCATQVNTFRACRVRASHLPVECVLLRCRKAKVTATIIERVTVDVVDEDSAWSGDYLSVHLVADALPVFIARSLANSVEHRGALDMPLVFRDPVEVFVVDDGVHTFAEWDCFHAENAGRRTNPSNRYAVDSPRRSTELQAAWHRVQTGARLSQSSARSGRLSTGSTWCA